MRLLQQLSYIVLARMSLSELAYILLSSCSLPAGWLPHGPKEIITQTSTTLAALDAAAAVLDTEGLISVAAYVGHEGGRRLNATEQASLHAAHDLNHL